VTSSSQEGNGSDGKWKCELQRKNETIFFINEDFSIEEKA